MAETSVQLGAVFNYQELQTGLEAGTEAFQQAMTSLETSFTEVSASAERSFSKISEDVKIAAGSVSAEWKQAATATAELSAANKDLAAAQALVRQTSGEDANALALLAAAQQRQKTAALEAAEATKVAATEIEVSAVEIRESMLKTLESAELTGAGIKSVFGGLGAVLGAGIAGQLFAGWLESTGEMIDHLEHLHRSTDISREDLQALQIAAQQLGISFDSVQTAIARLSKNAFAAVHNDTGVQAQAFHKLGIETKDLKELMNDFPELLLRVGEGLDKHASGATKVGIAQTLMGRGSILLAGSLGELALGAKQARTELETMGGIIDEKDVAAAHNLDVTTARLSAGWRSLMLPVFDLAVTALKTIESVLIGAKGEIQGYESAWVATAVSLKDSVVPVLKLIADVMTGQFSKAADDAKDVWNRFKDANAVAVQAMEAANAEAAKKIGAIWADVQTGPKDKTKEIGDDSAYQKRVEAAERKLAQAKIDARKAVRKLEDQMDAEDGKKLDEQAKLELKQELDKNNKIIQSYELKKKLADTQDESDRAHAASARELVLGEAEFEYQQGVISYSRLAEIRKKALDDRYADDRKAIQNEISMETQGTVAYEKLKAKERAIDDKYRLETQKLDQQAFVQRTKRFTDFFNSIGANFKTSINGWLQGTQSFTQAFGKMWDSLAVSAIDSIESIGIAWVNKHVFMALIHKLFSASKTADDAKSATTEAAITATTNTALATSAANLGAANAYAFWAWDPPVAAAAASAALAAGMAFATAAGAAATAGAGTAAGEGAAGIGITTAARGAVLGEDQLVFAHADEMILPPGISKPLQKALSQSGSSAFGGGGGGTVVVQQNVTALDGIGVARVLRNNRKSVTREITRAMRGGARIR